MSHRTRRRLTQCSLFVLSMPLATACTTWKHIELAPTPPSGYVPSQTVRVTKRDGSQLTIRNAQLRGDTLHGVLANVPSDLQLGEVAVPMAAVADVRARRVSVIKVLSGGAASVFFVWVLTLLPSSLGT